MWVQAGLFASLSVFMCDVSVCVCIRRVLYCGEGVGVMGL